MAYQTDGFAAAGDAMRREAVALRAHRDQFCNQALAALHPAVEHGDEEIS